MAAACLLVACGGGGGSGGGSTPPAVVTLQSVSVTPPSSSIEHGTEPGPATATGHYSDSSTQNLTASANWTSTNTGVATIASGGVITTLSVGTTQLQAEVGGITGSATISVTAPGHTLVKHPAIYTQFDLRGASVGFWSGDLLQRWTQVDGTLGITVATEVAAQLDEMHALGVDTITFELRSADATYTGSFTPPDCNIPPVLGVQFPAPTATELTNLHALLDLLGSKGMHMWLRLVNTHMEEQPPTRSEQWLTAILNEVGNHAALDAVLFEGNTYTVNGGADCGIPAEPPLYLGPDTPAAKYVQWALGLGRTLGVPVRKLSAEAIAGFYMSEVRANAGADANDFHLWPPVEVLDTLFDRLAFPQAQRTYALSMYLHDKCYGVSGIPCTDTDPHTWGDTTLAAARAITGPDARIIITEMGQFAPVNSSMPTTAEVEESLGFLMHRYDVEGGAFWRWVAFDSGEDADAFDSQPVKRRGAVGTYLRVATEFTAMSGLHLPLVPNGSFETTSGGVPTRWSIAGQGTGASRDLSSESGQPRVPWRGTHALRLTTGAGSNDVIEATSARIPVRSGVAYTTALDLRFSFSGDPSPTAAADVRPRITVEVRYLKSDGTPSAIRASDDLYLHQEDGDGTFHTAALQYTTPSDATQVVLAISASRAGLPGAITVDADDVR